MSQNYRKTTDEVIKYVDNHSVTIVLIQTLTLQKTPATKYTSLAREHATIYVLVFLKVDDDAAESMI